MINEELKQKYNISDEDYNAVNQGFSDKMAEEKQTLESELTQGFSGKASADADNIISSVSKPLADKYGFRERDKGEKAQDYYKAIHSHIESSFDKGAVNEDLERFKTENDALLKQVAELEPLKDIQGKYSELLESNAKVKKKNAFNSVKPTFKEDANEYEVNGKWREIEKDIDAKYDIEEVDGVWMALDKNNKYKSKKLKDIVSGYKSIDNLLSSPKRKKGISSSNPSKRIDGVPFEILDTDKKTDVYAKTSAYLMKEKGLRQHHKEWDAEYTKIVTEAKKHIK